MEIPIQLITFEADIVHSGDYKLILEELQSNLFYFDSAVTLNRKKKRVKNGDIKIPQNQASNRRMVGNFLRKQLQTLIRSRDATRGVLTLNLLQAADEAMEFLKECGEYLETKNKLIIKLNKRDVIDTLLGNEWDIRTFGDSRFNYITCFQVNYQKNSKRINISIRFVLSRFDYKPEYRNFLPNYVN
jgi:hypothetical protein